jgi:hypothetical protein
MKKESAMKPRYKERIALRSRVTFTLGSHSGEGRLLDLTSPGCLIESSVAIQKGQSLQLIMFLPGLKSPLTIMLGVVRWTNGQRFGVEFIKMDETNRLGLNQFMSRHLPAVADRKPTETSLSEPGGPNWQLRTYSISKTY